MAGLQPENRKRRDSGSHGAKEKVMMSLNYFQTTNLSRTLDRYDYRGAGKAQNLNLLTAALEPCMKIFRLFKIPGNSWDGQLTSKVPAWLELCRRATIRPWAMKMLWELSARQWMIWCLVSALTGPGSRESYNEHRTLSISPWWLKEPTHS